MLSFIVAEDPLLQFNDIVLSTLCLFYDILLFIATWHCFSIYGCGRTYHCLKKQTCLSKTKYKISADLKKAVKQAALSLGPSQVHVLKEAGD